MRLFLLLLPLLLFPVPQQDNEAQPPVTVVKFGWTRDRQPAENAVSASVPPMAAMTANDKLYARQRRVNDPAGMRDPNADTLDSRASELERIVSQSRAPEPVSGYAYQVKVQNGGSQPTLTVFWEYEFTEKGNPANSTHRDFLCLVKIKPEQERDLRVFSLRGPSDTVSWKNAGKMNGGQLNEAVKINRVEYADGTAWQRNGWSLEKFKLTTTARSHARDVPMCRSL
jgi:hypothetical protein